MSMQLATAMQSCSTKTMKTTNLGGVTCEDDKTGWVKTMRCSDGLR